MAGSYGHSLLYMCMKFPKIKKLSIIKTYPEAHLSKGKLHSLTMSNPPL